MCTWINPFQKKESAWSHINYYEKGKWNLNYTIFMSDRIYGRMTSMVQLTSIGASTCVNVLGLEPMADGRGSRPVSLSIQPGLVLDHLWTLPGFRAHREHRPCQKSLDRISFMRTEESGRLETAREDCLYHYHMREIAKTSKAESSSLFLSDDESWSWESPNSVVVIKFGKFQGTLV